MSDQIWRKRGSFMIPRLLVSLPGWMEILVSNLKTKQNRTEHKKSNFKQEKTSVASQKKGENTRC